MKKCVVCDAEPEFCVKGIPHDAYCRECAEEHFSDLGLLERIKKGEDE